MAKILQLFGRQLSISDAFLLEIRLRRSAIISAETAAKEFEAYYNSLSGMEDLVRKGWDGAYKILSQHAGAYVKLLTSLGIYTISALDLLHKMDGSYFEQALTSLEDWYISIQNDEAKKDAYRKARRQNRSRWVGGGFGLGGAIKGAAQAGAMNLASGAIHGAVNLVGKGISTLGAAMSESAMFHKTETRKGLEQALYMDVYDMLYILQDEIKRNHIAIEIISRAGEEKANSLFQNLKTLTLNDDQAQDVAFQLFSTNPAELEYYAYCFRRFPAEQKNLIQLGEYCSVDLTSVTEPAFEQLFQQIPHETEEETLLLYEKLKEKQLELGVTNSETIRKVKHMLVEFDIQARTFLGVLYDTREEKSKAEADYDVLSERCAYVTEAEEEACVQLREEISKGDYVPQVLQLFLDRIRTRIEDIWSAEDGQIFDNILLNTDISNNAEIDQSINYIMSSGRTENKNRYVDALEGLRHKNLNRARKYGQWRQNPLAQRYMIQVLLVLIGYQGMEHVTDAVFGWFFLMLCLGCIWLIATMIWEKTSKSVWNLLTLDGTVIHSALREQEKDKKGEK